MITELQLETLRTGRLTTSKFRVFQTATLKDWQRIARMLLRRFKCPIGVVDQEDITQELLIGCFVGVQTFDPDRGVTLRSFVLFTAISRAKKWLHTQRKALRRADNAPSRLTQAFSSFIREDGEGDQLEASIEALSGVHNPATQELHAERSSAFRSLETETQEIVQLFLSCGKDVAAWRLLERQDLREATQTSRHKDARRAVSQSVRQLVQEFG